MTSNAGAEQIVSPKRLGFDTGGDEKAKNYQIIRSRVMEEVHRLFRPEFLNRVDDIIVFQPITKEDLRAILDIMMRDMVKNALEELNIRLHLDADAANLLIERGYDPKYGARPLRRVLQTELEDKLAEEILSGHIAKNSSVRIGVDKDGKTLKFQGRRLPSAGTRRAKKKSTTALKDQAMETQAIDATQIVAEQAENK